MYIVKLFLRNQFNKFSKQKILSKTKKNKKINSNLFPIKFHNHDSIKISLSFFLKVKVWEQMFRLEQRRTAKYCNFLSSWWNFNTENEHTCCFFWITCYKKIFTWDSKYKFFAVNKNIITKKLWALTDQRVASLKLGQLEWIIYNLYLLVFLKNLNQKNFCYILPVRYTRVFLFKIQRRKI